MGLIDRFNAPRQSRNGRITVWSSEPTDILDELAAEDAEVIRAKPVRAIALDVAGTLGDLFGGLVERIAPTEDQERYADAHPDAVPATEGRSLDALRRWLRTRRMPEDAE